MGLDDIRHSKSSTAWGAKTVKGKPFGLRDGRPQQVRLISGRNAPIYSYDQPIDPKSSDANELGRMVLAIWNKRVSEVRAEFENLRTVVLLKSDDLLTLAVFELPTVMYHEDNFLWKWNKKSNLEGYDKGGKHCFTWQPHGSQFTIKEDVPQEALKIRINKPKSLSRDMVLKEVGFGPHSYQVIE